MANQRNEAREEVRNEERSEKKGKRKVRLLYNVVGLGRRGQVVEVDDDVLKGLDKKLYDKAK